MISLVAEIVVLFVAAIWEIIWRFPLKYMKTNEQLVENVVNERIKKNIDDYYKKGGKRIENLVSKLEDELVPLKDLTRNMRNFRWLVIAGILLDVLAILWEIMPDPVISMWAFIPSLVLGVLVIEIPIMMVLNQGKIEKFIKEKNGDS